MNSLKRIFLWLILWVSLVGLACSASGAGTDNARYAPAGDGTEYPQEPEEVVSAFLAAQQEDPKQMERYLSTTALAQLPPEGAVEMLHCQDVVMGYLISSASVSQNPPGAIVEVNLTTGQAELGRAFVLLRQNGVWVIDEILALP
ncbi:hypothetical protein ADN00_01955 [Ornatilinea apprima]|uniref:DUF3828 domain-containing protein n=1 Tax=Ornatilinea apprima TaxID=1134406 RepID=A0A0P6XIU0_9CHLR|nr:hypothetical protein ADN00_01955 [Ornatilinea apprima]